MSLIPKYAYNEYFLVKSALIDSNEIFERETFFVSNHSHIA